MVIQIIKNLVKKIKLNLRVLEFIEGIIVYGSYIRNELDPFSDIDLILYISDENNLNQGINLITEKILGILAEIDEGTLHYFQRYDKVVFYSAKNFIKLEIMIKKLKNFKGDLPSIMQSRIKIIDIDNCILYDPSGFIRKSLLRFLENYSLDYEEEFKKIINGFLYYFDGFLVNFSRADVFKAYMNYTISFYKLAAILSMH